MSDSARDPAPGGRAVLTPAMSAGRGTSQENLPGRECLTQNISATQVALKGWRRCIQSFPMPSVSRKTAVRTGPKPLVISAVHARRLLMHAQGLLEDPAAQKPATTGAVVRLIEQMGFVQIDTISTV